MSYIEVVGFVPESLRSVMSQPLPNWTISAENPLLKLYSGVYHSNDELRNGQRAGRYEDELGGEYVDLFNSVANIGHISCSRAAYVQIDLVQGPASEIGNQLGWHTDEGLHYQRLVVCDKYGTLYGSREAPITTPDYGILSFDDEALHKPNLGPEHEVKTRLQVTSVPRSPSRLFETRFSMD